MRGKPWWLIASRAFNLGDLGGKYNVSGIGPSAGQVASWTGGTDVTLSRDVYMCAGEITSPLTAHKTQVFVASHSVAYAFITEEHRAGPAIHRTSEEKTAMERYGAVAMNYIEFSAYYRSRERASRRSTDVERDNHIFADLARRTSVIEAGKKLSACGLRSCSLSERRRCGNQADERTREEQGTHYVFNQFHFHKSYSFLFTSYCSDLQ